MAGGTSAVGTKQSVSRRVIKQRMSTHKAPCYVHMDIAVLAPQKSHAESTSLGLLAHLELHVRLEK